MSVFTKYNVSCNSIKGEFPTLKNIDINPLCAMLPSLLKLLCSYVGIYIHVLGLAGSTYIVL